MGIGIVIFFWLFIFSALGVIYFLLHFLAKKNEAAAALKDAFLALFGVGAIAVICFIAFTVGDGCLNYFYPSRIFTKNFGFEPTADVRIIEGSSFWTPLGYSTHLRFQANEETIQKLVSKGFYEKDRSYKTDFSDVEAKKILEQPESHYYQKTRPDMETILYNSQSQNAYFSLESFD